MNILEKELIETAPRTLAGLAAKAKALKVTTHGAVTDHVHDALFRDITTISGTRHA